MKEIWKDIKGYEGLYQVSNRGKVRSLRRNITLRQGITNKSKVVLQYSLDGTFVKEWKSTRDIQRMTGYSSGCISECCRNIRKSAYGYIWKYKNEEG